MILGAASGRRNIPAPGGRLDEGESPGASKKQGSRHAPTKNVGTGPVRSS
jgi:hypothetical protein